MNMEIKFRCWTGEQMVSPDYIDRDGVAWWKENGVPESSKSVMQYTGMKDKNGTEIYEGDVLEMRIPISINGTRLHNVEIFSQGYAFWFKTIIYPGYTDCLWFHYNASDRKIIGNIYENPDLLK